MPRKQLPGSQLEGSTGQSFLVEQPSELSGTSPSAAPALNSADRTDRTTYIYHAEFKNVSRCR